MSAHLRSRHERRLVKIQERVELARAREGLTESRARRLKLWRDAVSTKLVVTTLPLLVPLVGGAAVPWWRLWGG